MGLGVLAGLAVFSLNTLRIKAGLVKHKKLEDAVSFSVKKALAELPVSFDDQSDSNTFQDHWREHVRCFLFRAAVHQVKSIASVSGGPSAKKFPSKKFIVKELGFIFNQRPEPGGLFSSLTIGGSLNIPKPENRSEAAECFLPVILRPGAVLPEGLRGRVIRQLASTLLTVETTVEYLLSGPPAPLPPEKKDQPPT